MQPLDIETLASRHVPGSGAPLMEPLRAGLAHETYRVRRGDSCYALRVPAEESVDLGLDRAWEARVLERAAAAGLAPPMRYWGQEQGVLVLDWIEGRPWTPAETRLPGHISRMAATLSRLHALPAPHPARTVSPAQWIELYSAALAAGGGGERGAGAREAGARGADQGGAGAAGGVLRSGALERAAAERAAEAAVLGRGERVLCHSDLHVLNVVDPAPAAGGPLVLLDFEYAHVTDPFWDLAGWSANNDFGPELTGALAEAYRGRPPTASERARLELLGWLYDYVCLLWSALYLRREPDPEIGARARVIEGRLTAALG
jgi:aminoglycoside phosphotransferase (APT) family kinase protein